MAKDASVAVNDLPKISVVVPAYKATHHLRRSLPPLHDMLTKGDIFELIVADDHSPDDTAAVAASLGARVITLPKNVGPGAARNYAADFARGDVLWFVDADVVVHPDGGKIVQDTFKDPTVAAVFGSYDETPSVANFASQYKNLTHHFYHQRAREEASTFWSGCGAVRRETFLKMDGFDVTLFSKPSVEDIELGYRLRAQGDRVLLRRDLLSTHLKKWTLKEVIIVDIFRRAIPWSRLMIRRKMELTNDLNINKTERARALLAGLLVLSFLAPIFGVWLWLVPAGMLALVFAANFEFFVFMMRAHGLFFGIGATLFHQVYYLYSGVSYAYCLAEEVLGLKNLRVAVVSTVRPRARA
ncbi:hypothetical protein BH11PSE2_BH11PSE2_08960 [soil metagenome]